MESTIIISHFDGSNNIFADCTNQNLFPFPFFVFLLLKSIAYFIAITVFYHFDCFILRFFSIFSLAITFYLFALNCSTISLRKKERNITKQPKKAKKKEKKFWIFINRLTIFSVLGSLNRSSRKAWLLIMIFANSFSFPFSLFF